MKLAVTVTALLSMVAAGHALECYTCKSTTSFAGASSINLPADAKLCSEFDTEDPDDSFKYTCPASHQKGCALLKDKTNEKNQIRGCIASAQDTCLDIPCICSGDMCNGAGAGWPSAMLVLAALAAAGVAGRR